MLSKEKIEFSFVKQASSSIDLTVEGSALFENIRVTWVTFTNILRVAFMPADPINAKKTVNSRRFLRFQDLQA